MQEISYINPRREDTNPKEGQVKYVRTSLEPDVIEKKFYSLKDKIVVLKGRSSKPENMDVDIEPPFVDEILAEPILDQF